MVFTSPGLVPYGFKFPVKARHKKPGYYTQMMKRERAKLAKRRQYSRPSYVRLKKTVGTDRYKDYIDSNGLQLSGSNVATWGTSQGGVAQNILDIEEGTGEQERLGKNVNIKDIMWRWYIELPPAQDSANAIDGTTNYGIRIVVVWDYNANGSNASWTEVFANNSYNSFKNLDQGRRFRILKDYKCVIDAQTEWDESLNQVIRFRTHKVGAFYFKNLNLNVQYEQADGEVDSRPRGNLIIFCRTNNGDEAAAGPIIHGRLRIRYTT